MKIFNILSAALISTILLVNSGCIPKTPPEDPLKQEAAAALDRAQTSLMAEKTVAVDVLWVLANIQKKQTNPEVDWFIEKMKGKIRNPHYLPGVFPDRPKIQLPESVPAGIRGFTTFLSAPLGEPQETAVKHLEQFISEEAAGYILTHQLIVLLLAEQAGLPIAPETEQSKSRLLSRIYREQSGMSTVDCVDLYMERVALLLFFGNRENLDQQAVNAWIKTIIGTQLPDGSWPLSKSSLSFDGETTALSSPRSHTTVLAMMALQAYLGDG